MKSGKKLGSRRSSSDESRLIVEKIPHSEAFQLKRSGGRSSILQLLDLVVQGVDPGFLADSTGGDGLVVQKNSPDVGFSLLHVRWHQSENATDGGSIKETKLWWGKRVVVGGRRKADVKGWSKMSMDSVQSGASRPFGVCPSPVTWAVTLKAQPVG